MDYPEAFERDVHAGVLLTLLAEGQSQRVVVCTTGKKIFQALGADLANYQHPVDFNPVLNDLLRAGLVTVRGGSGGFTSQGSQEWSLTSEGKSLATKLAKELLPDDLQKQK